MPATKLPNLVLGIDGGATNTAAVLADANTGATVGRSEAGPSNIQAVGVTAALKELNSAVAGAFRAARLTRAQVGAAVLGLAGVDLNEGVEVIRGWADIVQLSKKLKVANDATLLFAAGTPEGWGLAVIAGTGSIAFTRDAEGKTGRAGGWGYLPGDEGSAFRLGLLGLRAACRAADGIGDTSSLLPAFLEKLESNDPREFIPTVYRGSWDKAYIAGLAPVVLEAAAGGDRVALGIVEQETHELARTAAGAVAAGGLSRDGVPIALAGGLVLRSEFYRSRFLKELGTCGVTPGPVGLVDDPVVGAVVLARKLLSEREA